MKKVKFLLLLVTILMVQLKVNAHSWNEPWQKEIIMRADYFILAEIVSETDSIGTKVKVIKHFGEQELKGEILITNHFKVSAHGSHSRFKKGKKYYLFLNKDKDGGYITETPTSSFAELDNDNNVTATYRHSYHQALVSKDIYEKTYIEIWNYYKTSHYNKENVITFINETLKTKPAGFEPNEVATFFLQHVAMETAYLLDITIELDVLNKYLEFDNFHSKVSALQLLRHSNQKKAKQYLFDFIKKEGDNNFEKVIAIWSLAKNGGKKYKNKLREIQNELSEESLGFGGNIMDPRVSTFFPSPRGAVANLK